MRQTFADFFAVSGSVLDVAVVFVLEFVVAVHGGSDFYILFNGCVPQCFGGFFPKQRHAQLPTAAAAIYSPFVSL